MHLSLGRDAHSHYEGDGVKYGALEVRADAVGKLDRAERRVETSED